MTRLSLRAGLLAVAVAALPLASTAPVAAGDPDFWSVAAQPRLAADLIALRQAQRLYLDAREIGVSTDAGLDLLRVARQVLESADAAHGSDPRLPFFYGRILVDLSEDRLAVGVLADALARAGDHPGASDAWFALAIAYARLNDPTAEVAAYDAQLAREIDPEARSVTLNNQAEGFVLAGDLDTATSKYRAALELTPDSGLAHWGFAVTLDRSGDLFAALEEARLALVYDPDARRLRSDEVFFIPAYDKHWYLALGAMVQAKTDPDATSRLIAWEQAAVLWRKYLDDAVVTDPWVAMARARLALCVKELGRRNTKPAPAFTSRGVRR